MSDPTRNNPFRRTAEAARLRRAFQAATTPQPELVPSLSASPTGPSPGNWSRASRWWGEACAWLAAAARRSGQAQRGRRLRVLETVGLGEKRFLAIVQAGNEEFLVGSAPAGLSLLTRLRDQAAADPVAGDSLERAGCSSASSPAEGAR